MEEFMRGKPENGAAEEELLDEDSTRVDEDQIRNAVEGKMILVTGAGGSIGSELCRQIARFHPAGIVGFEIAESALFAIDREMQRSYPLIPFHAEIGSIQNRARIDEVLGQYRPEMIFHTAAYKHVPLMEAHPFEAVENNIFGTYNVAVAAAEHNVEDYILISTDKAARPTSVMGATKRATELLLAALKNGRTRYVAIRLGNILGSNGSVVPIFKQQIAAGGPVTVTHPAMRRYFMTNPNACRLLLQASAIGEGGGVYVLDMGTPIKILDLAKKMILLSGYKQDEIKIEFTGIRPGEKLEEEGMLEGTIPTRHEKIWRLQALPTIDLLTGLESLRDICEAHDLGRLVAALKEVVPEYSPSASLIIRARRQETIVAV
jgi:FlaA1/EpsC-like NDP-sugar epimerase